jgi:beta-glucosidase-like glycosyl hydrolase
MGAFVWARRALKHQKRRFPARADPPFAGAVEAGVGSIMCSYNKINADATQHVGDAGTWSCENPITLKRDLKARPATHRGATQAPRSAYSCMSSVVLQR